MTISIRLNKTNEVYKDGFKTVAEAQEVLNTLDKRKYYVHDENWKEREKARPNLIDLTLWGLYPIPGHYLHVSPKSSKDQFLVSFTESPEKGARNRQASGRRIGSYLQEFFQDYIKHIDISRMVAEIEAMYDPFLELKFAYTAEEIRWVYENSAEKYGTESCMSGRRHWEYMPEGVEHPVEAYAGPDLAVAYLATDGKHVVARAVVWPEKKRWVRLYGQFERLSALLEKEGYKAGQLTGARLTRIKSRYSHPGYEYFVCPYIDGNQRVSLGDDERYLVVGEVPNQDYAMSNTSGLVSFRVRICAATGKKLFGGGYMTVMDPATTNDVYVDASVFDDPTYVWRRGLHRFLRREQDMVMVRGESVPRAYRDYYMFRSYLSGEMYHEDEVVRLRALRFVSMAEFARHFAYDELTGKAHERKNMVQMAHGAWWTKENFQKHGITIDGKNYAKFLLEQEAA